MTEHPLHTPWTLYFQQSNEDDSDDSDDYASSIHRIAKVSTVEQFWTYFSHIRRPYDLARSTELHIFRNDARGMWEDEENLRGGKWLLCARKDSSAELWELCVLSLIGERLHPDIIGAVISIRNTDILSLWNRNADDPEIVAEVADSIISCLRLPAGTTLRYKQHQTPARETRARTQTLIVGQSDRWRRRQ